MYFVCMSEFEQKYESPKHHRMLTDICDRLSWNLVQITSCVFAISVATSDDNKVTAATGSMCVHQAPGDSKRGFSAAQLVTILNEFSDDAYKIATMVTLKNHLTPMTCSEAVSVISIFVSDSNKQLMVNDLKDVLTDVEENWQLLTILFSSPSVRMAVQKVLQSSSNICSSSQLAWRKYSFDFTSLLCRRTNHNTGKPGSRRAASKFSSLGGLIYTPIACFLIRYHNGHSAANLTAIGRN